MEERAEGARRRQRQRQQSVIVMRHGDRIDLCESAARWSAGAPRPWDPPLLEPEGRIRASAAGKRIRDLDLPVHRVIVSPFLRCLQTAAHVVAALCSHDQRLLPIDPTRVKVSIEYGLCEVFGPQAINPHFAPKDGKWFPSLSELEALLPDGTLDRSVEHVYAELPCWEEQFVEARCRYKNVINALADKFPHENLLLVTHGEAVGVAVSSFLKDVEVFDVEYCAHVHLQRSIIFDTPQHFFAEDFRVLTNPCATGVSYYPPKVFNVV